jgi:hypothetical protein
MQEKYNNNIKTDNSSFERVEHFIYLRKTLTNQNSTHEKMKSRLESGNAGYRLVQNICLPVCYPKI